MLLVRILTNERTLYKNMAVLQSIDRKFIKDKHNICLILNQMFLAYTELALHHPSSRHHHHPLYFCKCMEAGPHYPRSAVGNDHQ